MSDFFKSLFGISFYIVLMNLFNASTPPTWIGVVGCIICIIYIICDEMNNEY